MRKICNCKHCVCKFTVEVADTDWRVEAFDKYNAQVMLEELQEEALDK